MMFAKGAIGILGYEKRTSAQVDLSRCAYKIVTDSQIKGKIIAEGIRNTVVRLEKKSSGGARFWAVVMLRVKENLTRSYVEVLNERYFPPSLGHHHYLRKMCVLDSTTVGYYPSVGLFPMMSGEQITTQLLQQPRVEADDPYQEFEPSENLTRLISRHMVKPSEKTIRIIEQLKRLHPDTDSQKGSIKNIVSDQIENLLTSLAQRVSSGESVKITSDRRFTSEICSEIIERLELDSYNPTPVLDQLFTELMVFLSYPRKREWGSVVVDHSIINLHIKEGVFEMPLIGSSHRNYWSNF